MKIPTLLGCDPAACIWVSLLPEVSLLPALGQLPTCGSAYCLPVGSLPPTGKLAYFLALGQFTSCLLVNLHRASGSAEHIQYLPEGQPASCL
jgi:hypothetical protein